MPKIPIINSQKLVRALRKMGFFEVHQVGSHVQFKHADGRRVTVPVHTGKDVKTGTLRAILRDIDISIEDFISFL
jgi:predicted RNA binding protein YcfA (HicA-like mRNA interferase family)